MFGVVCLRIRDAESELVMTLPVHDALSFPAVAVLRFFPSVILDYLLASLSNGQLEVLYITICCLLEGE